jgi:hypothetical protein
MVEVFLGLVIIQISSSIHSGWVSPGMNMVLLASVKSVWYLRLERHLTCDVAVY